MSLAVVRDLRSPRTLGSSEDAAAYQEHLLAGTCSRAWRAESWTPLSAPTSPLSRRSSTSPGCGRGRSPSITRTVSWARPSATRRPGTRRAKANSVDTFSRFLELRYRGEIHELSGRIVASPIDEANRPTHSGDFTVRVPPAPKALETFFRAWRVELAGSRKWLTAGRHYAMARLAAEVGLRLRELCGLALDDLYFDHGPIGKIHIRLGKGSRSSGPRERLVPMLGDARPLLVWWVQDVRGEFSDDWELPRAPLFPSERGEAISGAPSLRRSSRRQSGTSRALFARSRHASCAALVLPASTPTA